MVERADRPSRGRSNARGRRTRAHLERVALELFARDGFEATTVEAIAEAAGVSPRTFFHHFPSKHDLLWGDPFEELNRFGEVLLAQDVPDLRQALLAAIVAHADANPYGELDLLRLQAIRQSGLDPDGVGRWEAAFSDLLGSWLATRLGLPATDLRVRAAATALNAVRSFVVEEWAATGGSADVGELARTALSVLDVTLPGAVPAPTDGGSAATG